MIEMKLSADSICTLPKTHDILLPELRSLINAKQTCKKLKGKVTVVTDASMQERLVAKFKHELPDHTNGRYSIV